MPAGHGNNKKRPSVGGTSVIGPVRGTNTNDGGTGTAGDGPGATGGAELLGGGGTGTSDGDGIFEGAGASDGAGTVDGAGTADGADVGSGTGGRGAAVGAGTGATGGAGATGGTSMSVGAGDDATNTGGSLGTGDGSLGTGDGSEVSAWAWRCAKTGDTTTRGAAATGHAEPDSTQHMASTKQRSNNDLGMRTSPQINTWLASLPGSNDGAAIRSRYGETRNLLRLHLYDTALIISPQRSH